MIGMLLPRRRVVGQQSQMGERKGDKDANSRGTSCHNLDPIE